MVRVEVLPEERDRVRPHGPQAGNETVERHTLAAVAHALRTPGGIEARLRALDGERSLERALLAQAAMISLAGLLLAKWKRGFLWAPRIVLPLLLHQAAQGWRLPFEIGRRFGKRSAKEIEAERMALKALRGDWRDLPVTGDARGRAAAALQAAAT